VELGGVPLPLPGGVYVLLVRRFYPDCGGPPVDHWLAVFGEPRSLPLVSPLAVAGNYPQLETRLKGFFEGKIQLPWRPFYFPNQYLPGKGSWCHSPCIVLQLPTFNDQPMSATDLPECSIPFRLSGLRLWASPQSSTFDNEPKRTCESSPFRSIALHSMSPPLALVMAWLWAPILNLQP
jgi:hypothetical protein